MFDAMNHPIAVGDTVIVGKTGGGAAALIFARVKSVGRTRVTLESIPGHPKTIPAYRTNSTRAHADVLVVQL